MTYVVILSILRSFFPLCYIVLFSFAKVATFAIFVILAAEHFVVILSEYAQNLSHGQETTEGKICKWPLTRKWLKKTLKTNTSFNWLSSDI